MTTDPTHANDEELVAHAGFVRALASSLLEDSHEAEDLAQDALAVGATDARKARQGLRAWLSGVTRNLARMRQRSAGRRRQYEAAVRQVRRQPSPDDLAVRLEAERRLIVALQELREPYQSTLVARYYDGLKPGQIAKRDGVPVDTVRTRVQRGLAQLRKQLDEEHGGNRRAWTLALLPFALPKGFLPAAGGGAATGASAAAGVKVAVGTVALAVVAAVVVVATRTTDPGPRSTPDVAPVTVPDVPGDPTRSSPPARRTPQTANDYLRRINDGESAWLVATEIAALPPARGRDIVLAIFPDIDAWVRRHEVQKAFVSAGHAHAHCLLEVATRDESEWVRDAAFGYLQELFLRGFRTNDRAFREWYAYYGGRPLALALRENAREYVNRLLWLEGDALSHELGRVGIQSKERWRAAGLDFAAEMREAGILERIAGYLGSRESRLVVAVAALRWFRELDMEAAALREIFTALLAGPAARDEAFVARMCRELSGPEHAWAAMPLLDLLEHPAGMTGLSYREVVTAVGGMGDDRAIPVLVGVLSAEGVSGSLQWTAHRGLMKLTGLELEATRQDAGWWRDWWRKNCSRHSEPARERVIPTLRPPR